MKILWEEIEKYLLGKITLDEAVNNFTDSIYKEIEEILNNDL